jgi:hypothetical protein
MAETYSETLKTNTIKLHADGNITYKTHRTIQCSKMLKYSIMAETYSETVKTNTIKLHADGNITYKTH